MSDTIERWSVPVLALLGLTVSAYLALLHWQGRTPPCGNYDGCAEVANSVYSEVFGLPTAALPGLLFLALVLLGLARIRFERQQAQATYILYSVAVAGTVFMAHLMRVELIELRALSFWDLGLTFITLVLLFLLTPEVWTRRAIFRSVPAIGRKTS